MYSVQNARALYDEVLSELIEEKLDFSQIDNQLFLTKAYDKVKEFYKDMPEAEECLKNWKDFFSSQNKRTPFEESVKSSLDFDDEVYLCSKFFIFLIIIRYSLVKIC